MDNRWVIQKRREMRKVVIYSIVGLIIVTGLVTLLSYAIYANSASRHTDLPAAISTPL